MRRKILTVLIVLLLAFIWGNSMLPPGPSEKLSRHVTDTVNTEVHTSAPSAPARRFTNTQIRKAAHFLEYAALGLLTLWWMLAGSLRLGKTWPQLVLFGLGTGFLDETIQIFSGRTDSITDVWLDLAGFTTGALLTLLCSLLFRRKRRNA